MSIADELGKLNELKKAGALSEGEFEQQKAALLAGARPSSASEYKAMSEVPFPNKFWVQALAIILVIPIGLVLMAFFKAYQKKKGEVRRVGIGNKIVLMVLGVLVWGSVLAGLSAPDTERTSVDRTETASERTSLDRTQTAVTATPAMPLCDSESAKGALKNAVEENAASNLATLKLLDVQNVKELSSNEAARLCSARLLLNSGGEAITYLLTETSDGDVLVEINPSKTTIDAAAKTKSAAISPDIPAQAEIEAMARAVIGEFKNNDTGFIGRVAATKECYAGLSAGSTSKARLRCLMMDRINWEIERNAPPGFMEADLKVDDYLSEEKWSQRQAENTPPLSNTAAAAEAKLQYQERINAALRTLSKQTQQ